VLQTYIVLISKRNNFFSSYPWGIRGMKMTIADLQGKKSKNIISIHPWFEYNMNGSNLKVDRKMVLSAHILVFLIIL